MILVSFNHEGPFKLVLAQESDFQFRSFSFPDVCFNFTAHSDGRAERHHEAVFTFINENNIIKKNRIKIFFDFTEADQ